MSEPIEEGEEGQVRSSSLPPLPPFEDEEEGDGNGRPPNQTPWFWGMVGEFFAKNGLLIVGVIAVCVAGWATWNFLFYNVGRNVHKGTTTIRTEGVEYGADTSTSSSSSPSLTPAPTPVPTPEVTPEPEPTPAPKKQTPKPEIQENTSAPTAEKPKEAKPPKPTAPSVPKQKESELKVKVTPPPIPMPIVHPVAPPVQRRQPSWQTPSWQQPSWQPPPTPMATKRVLSSEEMDKFMEEESRKIGERQDKEEQKW